MYINKTLAKASNRKIFNQGIKIYGVQGKMTNKSLGWWVMG